MKELEIMNTPMAFPLSFETAGGGRATIMGMSLRDYFAAQALAGLHCLPITIQGGGVQEAVEMAYMIADAMLEARQLEVV